MDNKDRRKKILKISGLIGLFLLVFGLSYALFTVTLNGTKKVKLKTGKLELQLLDANNNDITDANNAGYSINLDNQVPVDDETGLGTQAFEFKLKNNGTIDASYTIYLDDVALEEGENRIADEYIRYSLTKNGSNDEAKDLTTIGTNPNRKLDEGVIKKDETNTYTLKVWVKESADNNAMDKVFNTTLRVEGVQYVAPPAPNYGEEIASTQLSENITATYYQPEGTTGYNNINKVKRMSNVEKIDNETTYEGGTLVISGEGDMPDYETILFLADIESFDDFEGKLKYNPKNLVIEEGITKIGEGSFAFTSIDNVTFPNTLKAIGNSAFYTTHITNLVLPEGLESIGESAFDYDDHVMENGTLTSVTFPSTLKSIGRRAFVYQKSLTSVVLPEGLESIGESAFDSCENITNFNIPRTLTTLGSNSIRDLKVTELYLSSNLNLTINPGDETFWTKAENLKIYCETQEIADKINSVNTTYNHDNTTVIVDPSKF